MKMIGTILVALILFSLAGCRQPGFSAQSITRPHASVARATLPAVRSGSYVGVYEPDAPRSYDQILAFAKTIRRTPQLASYYSGWGEPFQVAFARAAQARNTVPLVQINPFGKSMSGIAAGRFDSYLVSYADQVRDYGHPVVIGFAHEMNGSWYPWGYHRTSPKTWVAAWRHVVTVFRRQGALNVTWMWTIDRNPGSLSVVPRYWPGAAYVDWVGIDGYYFKRDQTFASILAPAVRIVRSLTAKPILIAETGIGQVAGQAHKIPDLFAGIHRYHLLGLVWFDVCQKAGLYHQCWRLESHPTAMRAFRRGVASMEG